MGENICQWYDQSRNLISNIYKQLYISTLKKILKNGQKNWTLFQKGNADSQWAYEKMLNIANDQGTANKNTMNFYLISVRSAIIKNNMWNKCWQGYGEKRALVYCLWECKLIQPPWKSVEVPQNGKKRSTIWPLLITYLKKQKH